MALHVLLILSSMLWSLQTYKPLPATKEELMTFHSEDYINFLQTVTVDKQVRRSGLMAKLCKWFDLRNSKAAFSSLTSCRIAVLLSFKLHQYFRQQGC